MPEDPIALPETIIVSLPSAADPDEMLPWQYVGTYYFGHSSTMAKHHPANIFAYRAWVEREHAVIAGERSCIAWDEWTVRPRARQLRLFRSPVNRIEWMADARERFLAQHGVSR